MSIIGSVPNRPIGTADRDIAALLANFDYITADYDGNITVDNLATSLKNTFPKLLVPGDVKLAMGRVATASWGAGSSVSGVIAHGLGSAPNNVQLTAKSIATTVHSTGNGWPVEISWVALDATNIVYLASVSDGGTTNNATTIDWVAYL